MKKYPTVKQLNHLKKQGWEPVARGLAWKSPYGRRYYFSPRAAVVQEEKQRVSNDR